MANYYEEAQENVMLTFIEDNQRLEKELAEAKAKLQATEAEIDRLKGLVLYYKEDSAKGERMGRYVEGIRQKAFRPAYKENASVEAIITVMQQEKTTDLQVVADKLHVSYTTVYRRLKGASLFPITKNKVSEYYTLFCSE